jgi:hypothetical protein
VEAVATTVQVLTEEEVVEEAVEVITQLVLELAAQAGLAMVQQEAP